jgi:hypothetical protein
MNVTLEKGWSMKFVLFQEKTTLDSSTGMCLAMSLARVFWVATAPGSEGRLATLFKTPVCMRWWDLGFVYDCACKVQKFVFAYRICSRRQWYKGRRPRCPPNIDECEACQPVGFKSFQTLPKFAQDAENDWASNKSPYFDCFRVSCLGGYLSRTVLELWWSQRRRNAIKISRKCPNVSGFNSLELRAYISKTHP